MTENRKITHKIDPRAPYVLDTRDLGRRAGSFRHVLVSAPAPSGLALDLIRIEERSQLNLDLRMEAVQEGVLVSGAISAVAFGECGRCLRAVSLPVVAELQELYAYPDSTTVETTDEDEVERLVGDLLDLETAVRDAMLLALPLTPLCRADCPGLCDVCGEPRDQLPADHRHERRDPRWSVLQQLSDRPVSSDDNPINEEG